MKQVIFNRLTKQPLFEAEIPDDTPESLRIKAAVEAAVAAGANLNFADLEGADLYGANMCGANMRRANMHSAILEGANLSDANMCGANLEGADLEGAYLVNAEKLIGTRPVLFIGPLGSRSDYLTIYLTDKGVRVKVGCFFGSLDEFAAEVSKKHEQTAHAKEYALAIAFAKGYDQIWTPKP